MLPMKNKSSSPLKTMKKPKPKNRLSNKKLKPRTELFDNAPISLNDPFKVSVKELIIVRANKAAYAINAIKYEARIRAEQDADRLLKNMKPKILGQKYDEAAMTSDSRHKHYKANENRIECNDGILVRKYYNETGHIKTYQIRLPKQLVTEMLQHLHGEFGRHLGIAAAIINFRGKYYYPNMPKLIRNWITSCQKCIREKRIDNSLIRPPLQNPNDFITGPEDALQIDIVPGLPPSGGYENIVTAIDVFSRYLLAYPTASQSANTIARVIINIMTKHAYLPTTIISDKSSAFTSQVIKEVTNALGITLKHATTKHAQTIGMLERTHDALKRTLKIETGERRSMWHKYVHIAVLNHNTSYHSSIGCQLSRVFHGRIPYNVLDLKLGIRPQRANDP